MKRLLPLALLFLCLAPLAGAQTDTIQGFCDTGGVSAKTSGSSSANKLQGDIPSCKVEVFLTGTQTHATIYSNGSNTPLSNPFTAAALGAVSPGRWIFWISDGVHVDVMGSGGIPPNTYAMPTPLCVDCAAGNGGGGPQTIIETNGTPISPPSPANFVNTATVQWAFANDQITATVPGISPVQVVLPTSSINANTCTSPTAVLMPGTVAPAGANPGTTFAVIPESNPNAVNGWGAVGGLVMQVWATTDHLNWSICNQSGSSITPGALTVDVGASSGGGGGGGSGSVTSFSAPSGSWPSWLVPAVTNPTSTPSLAVAVASEPANEFLASPNGASGIMAPRAIVAADIPTLNQNTTGNAATATALAVSPSQCSTGQAAMGISASGNASGCFTPTLPPAGTQGAIQTNNGSGALAGTVISGVVFGNGTAVPSAATSPQLVTAINNTPSSTLAVALLPLSTSTTFGAIKPDNVSCTVSAGILACTGSGGGITTLTKDVLASGSGSAAATVVGINGTLLSGLASGLLYNTTSTGVPSIATSPQVITAINNSPSSTIATGALPTASNSALGIAECGTNLTCPSGVFTVATAATGTLGVSSPDNTTIGATTGVYHIISPGSNTVLGFNGSNAYTGFTAGINISLTGGQITNTSTANTVSTSLTSNTIPKANGANSIINSALSDNGTTLSYAPGSGSTIMGSNTAANVDGFGELVLSSSATVSYTFINSYATHPECTATPQFNAGTSIAGPWVTYTSTTSFTINYSASVSGTVTYHCYKRT